MGLLEHRSVCQENTMKVRYRDIFSGVNKEYHIYWNNFQRHVLFECRIPRVSAHGFSNMVDTRYIVNGLKNVVLYKAANTKLAI